MPATAARIGFITQQFRRVVSTTAQALTRHGNLARQSEDPVETYFDSEADAQAIADQRQALLSVDRRRFQTRVVGLDEVMALDTTGAVPTARYTDSERGVDGLGLVTDIAVDLDKQQASVGFWG